MKKCSPQRVLLFSIDNLRSDCVSANNNKKALSKYRFNHLPKTPTIDQIISNGVFFSKCFSAAPYTTASHATILTGLYPIRHGIREYYRTSISNSVKTLFQYFKEAGYVTVLATDFPALIGSVLGFTRSVDYFIEENDEEVHQLLLSLQTEKVFCFWHFGTVHNPFGLTNLSVDGKYFRQEVEKLAQKVGVNEPGELNPKSEWMERKRSLKERLLRQWYFSCTDLLYERGQYDDLMNLYTSGIERFDSHRFDMVVSRIKTEGLWDDSLISITADHGEEYSTRAFAHFNGLWDGIVNVPLILWGANIPQGKISNVVCRTCDIAPTLMDYSGILSSFSKTEFDGISLRPHIEKRLPLDITALGESLFGYTEQIRDFLASCYSQGRLLESNIMADIHIQYARDRRWKLVVRTNIEKNSESISLFDTIADPLENVNVAEKYPEAVKLLQNEISQMNTSINSFPSNSVEVSSLENVASALIDMGYLKENVSHDENQ